MTSYCIGLVYIAQDQLAVALVQWLSVPFNPYSSTLPSLKAIGWVIQTRFPHCVGIFFWEFCSYSKTLAWLIGTTLNAAIGYILDTVVIIYRCGKNYLSASSNPSVA